MTDRIDHAAKAREALAAAHEVPAEGQVADPWLLAAQTHATIALVEQQRIANLIALARYAGEYDESPDLLRMAAVNSLVTWKPHGPDDEHPEIRPDVASALGIKVRNGCP